MVMLYNSSGLGAPRVGRVWQAGGTTRRWRDRWEQRRSSRSGLRPRRLLGRAQKQRQRVVQAGLTGSRIEPARIELAAQPGQLALGQLAGGVDGALAELAGRPGAVQILPGLDIPPRPARRPLHPPQTDRKSAAWG